MMFELTTPEEVNEFLEKFPTGALFKAGSCHKTMEGFGHVETALNQRPDIKVGFIRVIESRPASNHVEAITAIKHESPQFILFVEGKPVFDVDNWDITAESMQRALEKHFGPADGEAVESEGSDLSVYANLLEKFVAGKLPEEEFEATWKDVFRNDATPRPKEDFELINSLYADRKLLGVGGKRPGLKERASDLLKELNG